VKKRNMIAIHAGHNLILSRGETVIY